MFDDTETFVLTNATPRRPTMRLDPDDRRQTVLFAGMDCLEGQRDLFGTDGVGDTERGGRDKAAAIEC